MAGPAEQRYVLFLFLRPAGGWSGILVMFEKTSSLASGSQLPLSTFLGPWMSLCLLPASTLNPEDQLLTMNVTLIPSEGSSWKPHRISPFRVLTDRKFELPSSIIWVFYTFPLEFPQRLRSMNVYPAQGPYINLQSFQRSCFNLKRHIKLKQISQKRTRKRKNIIALSGGKLLYNVVLVSVV